MNASQTGFNFGAPFAVLLCCAALLAIVSVLLLSSASLATPITLAFDAVVGPPQEGFDALVPPGLGISLEPGDVVSGRFTFLPVDAPSSALETNAVSHFPFIVNVKSAMLTATDFSVDVINDAHATDMDPIDRIDSITVDATAVYAPNVARWSSSFNLVGAASVLDGPDIPADASLWSAFLPSESFGVTFSESATNRYFGFIATINNFRAVPEPTGKDLMTVGAFILLFAKYCHPDRGPCSSTRDQNVFLSQA
jgi:hypothetical protein